jgi:ribonucleoside-diphosphate reductase beta chain
MTADIALWKSEDGLTEDERKIVKRNLGFSQPPIHWLPII